MCKKVQTRFQKVQPRFDSIPPRSNLAAGSTEASNEVTQTKMLLQKKKSLSVSGKIHFVTKTEPVSFGKKETFLLPAHSVKKTRRARTAPSSPTLPGAPKTRPWPINRGQLAKVSIQSYKRLHLCSTLRESRRFIKVTVNQKRNGNLKCKLKKKVNKMKLSSACSASVVFFLVKKYTVHQIKFGGFT